jgi:hypothetical protein
MPGTRDLDVYRGDDFSHSVTFKDVNGAVINVSARTFASQLRRYPDTSVIAATFGVDMTNAATGIVVFTLADTVTSTLDAGPYVYDVQQTDSGTVTTMLAGDVTVAADVTRASS